MQTISAYNMQFLTNFRNENLLSNAVYHVPTEPKEKLSFGIDTILAMKCSNQKTVKPGRSPRARTLFTPQQIVELDRAYKISKYIVGNRRMELASRLNLDEKPIRIWFQHRRSKDRRARSHSTHSDSDSASSDKTCWMNRGACMFLYK